MKTSQIVAKNIKRQLKKRKIRIGDMEKQLGLCKGYFSRHALGKGTMGVDIVYKISSELNIPIDTLCAENNEE